MGLEISSLGERAVEIDIDGKLEKPDYDAFNRMVEQKLRHDGKIDMLIRVSDFGGWSPSAVWEDLKFNVSHYNDVRRMALVSDDTDEDWMRRLTKPFTGADVEAFSGDELEAARAWIREPA